MKTKTKFNLFTRCLFLTLFILFQFNHIASAQEVKDSISKWHSNNILKINLISLFYNSLELGYERVISERFSAFISYGEGSKRTFTGNDAKENYVNKYGGYRFNYILGNTEQIITVKNHLSIEFRYYLSYKHTRIPGGFHLAPSINFLNYSEVFKFYDDKYLERDIRENNYKVVSINASLGPQILIHRIIAIDPFIAPGFGILSASEGSLNNTTKKTKDTGVGLTISFGIFCGIAIGK